MKRRDFLYWVGAGALASSLPVALAACTPSSTDDAADTDAEPAADAAPVEDGFEVIGSVGDLDSKGSLLKKGTAAGPVLVIRDPDNANSVIAVNPKCTHQGCDVKWKAGDAVFDCACHGSQFAADGSVLNGPASTNLDNYDVEIQGDQVVIKTS